MHPIPLHWPTHVKQRRLACASCICPVAACPCCKHQPPVCWHPPCTGLRFEGVPLEQVGVAVALATADNPSLLPLRATERKAVEARQVG